MMITAFPPCLPVATVVTVSTVSANAACGGAAVSQMLPTHTSGAYAPTAPMSPAYQTRSLTYLPCVV